MSHQMYSKVLFQNYTTRRRIACIHTALTHKRWTLLALNAAFRSGPIDFAAFKWMLHALKFTHTAQLWLKYTTSLHLRCKAML